MGQNNALNTTLSGQTGTGAFVGNNAGLLINPVLDAAVATSLSFTTTSGIIGTTTNNAAAAGSVGEIISSIKLAGSALNLTSNVVGVVTSIVLSPGDWDLYGNLWSLSGATTQMDFFRGGFGSAGFNGTPAVGASLCQYAGYPDSGGANLV